MYNTYPTPTLSPSARVGKLLFPTSTVLGVD